MANTENDRADIELLESIDKTFLGDLFMDNLHDWTRAKQYGEFLISVCPTLLVGHLVLCRALRHSGHIPQAMHEIGVCRAIIAGRDFREHAFVAEFEREEHFLNAADPGIAQ
jgi:hypothetical protein